MIIDRLKKDGLITPPKWLPANTCYLTMMGSIAYGVSGDSSDVDVYGVCFPPKDDVFPHLRGIIPGFGPPAQQFKVWQEHHIKTLDGHKEYDFSVYSIVSMFQLCMENNPNMIDSLFTPRRCVLHISPVFEEVRSRRHIFLHKGSFHKFKGYAYSQLAKIKSSNLPSNPKRREAVEAFGYDTKHAYHVVRLALEAEQILQEGDLDLERGREQLKAIRRGEWTLDYLERWFQEKERQLEQIAADSPLAHKPDEPAIRQLLLDCLEHHYGSLSAVVQRQVTLDQVLGELRTVIDRYAA